jgi:hypothetical protein
MRVFVTRKLPEEALRIVREAAEMQVWPDELPPPYEVMFHCHPHADGGPRGPESSGWIAGPSSALPRHPRSAPP